MEKDKKRKRGERKVRKKSYDCNVFLRLVKTIKTNGKGNRDGEWIFCLMKEADVALFLQVTRVRHIRNKCVANLTSRLLPELNRTITKQRTLKRETNKTDRNPLNNHESQTMTF